jgi:[acyl-carrier-protein] S-malonyltransferase
MYTEQNMLWHYCCQLDAHSHTHRYIQAASDATDGAMVSVIGLDSTAVAALCKAAAEKAGKPVAIANYLCSGNYAVSGAAAACDVVEQIAKPEFKARMTVRLAVAGAFHTDFMGAAVDKVRVQRSSTACTCT